MRKEEFALWMSSVKGYTPRTVTSRVSNCARVESFEGDLDKHFEQDGLADLLQRLCYSKADHRLNEPARHATPIDGDIYNGTATLKAAVNLYKEFASGGPAGPYPQLPSAAARVKNKHRWPEWDMPSQEIIFQLTQMLTPYVRFLNPDIVAMVVEDNSLYRDQWREKLMAKGVPPDYYLWDKSSCAFPGIRRHSGGREIAYFWKHLPQDEIVINDAIRLDDNTMPKQIWSYIFRNKPIAKQGPPGYSLAHLADHKDYKNRRNEEFYAVGEAPAKLYGLYSCVSNTVFIPRNLLDITDFNQDVRLLLLNKAQRLYGASCNIVPPALAVRPPSASEWDVDNFNWSQPVGADENVGEFLAYRRDAINTLLG